MTMAANSKGYPPQVSAIEFLRGLGVDLQRVWVTQSAGSGGLENGGFAPVVLPKLFDTTAHYYSQALIASASVRRTNATFEAAWVFVLDDVGKVGSITGAKLDMSLINSPFGTPEPSYAVETSQGNWQVAFVLKPWVTDVDQWRCFLAAMKAHPTLGIGLDGAGDRTHYYRLPTGVNPKNGFHTRLYREFKGVTYTLDELASACGVDVSPAAVAAFLAGTAATASTAEQVPLDTLKAMLRHIPNGPLFDDRALWTKMAHAMASCSNEYPGEARDLFIEWSENRIDAKGKPARVTPGEAARVWDTLDDDHQATVGSIRRWVEELNPGNYEARASVGEGFTVVSDGTLPEPDSAKLSSDLFEELRLARQTPAHYARTQSPGGETFDPTKVGDTEIIPPTVLGYFQRGLTTMLLAVPGAGKSSLMQSTAAALLFERPALVDEADVGFPGDTVLVSNEDSKGIVTGKLRALMDYHGLTPADAKNQVHLFEGVKVLSRDGVSGKIVLSCEPFMRALIEYRKKADIALIVFDTLASITRGFEENSNDQMQVVMEFLNKLAHCAHAAVVVIHHVSKGGITKDGDISIYGGRGASSMAADTRSTIQALKPSTADKTLYKWDEVQAKAWVKVQPLKGSYDDPATWSPKWFHFKSVSRPAIDPRNNQATTRSYGILVPEVPAVTASPQAAFGGDLADAWSVLKGALKKGKVYGLAQSSAGKTAWKDLYGKGAPKAKAILDELIAKGVVTVRSLKKGSREIVWDGVTELPETLEEVEDEGGKLGED